MNRKQLVFSLLICLLAMAKGISQTALICNDLVLITLDEGCVDTIGYEEILEGNFCVPCSYEVHLDKVPPFGNGPWEPAIVGLADLDKSYTVRVSDLATGNKCWGNVEIGEALVCTDATIVQLPAGEAASVTAADLNIHLAGECFSLIDATIENGQASVTYDCDDLGVHILHVEAGGQAGYPVSCYTTVVVDDSGSECNSCISCPPAVAITMSTESDVLLTAYQSGSLAAFDAYGNSVYSGACSFEDSTYAVDIFTAPFGQNWFIRTWQGKDATGQVTASCQQVITFPNTQQITVSGRVFLDSIPDCQYAASEPGISIIPVVATRLPSNQQTIMYPNPDGSYSFDLAVDGQDSLLRIQFDLPPGLSSSCPTTLYIPMLSAVQHYSFDIGLQSELDCPLMQVSMDNVLMRRCFTNTFYVNYCNLGLVTADDAYVTITFDPLFEVLTSTIPWTTVDQNTYTFPLGDIPFLTCGAFQVNAYLSCDAVLGQTLCNGATIYPNQPCEGGAWDGPFVETSAFCTGDTVSLAVWNTGTQAMTQPGHYIVIEDVIMYREGDFQLNAGDSITIKMPANGSTWRIEAEQVANYPLRDEPSAVVEACNGLTTPGLVNAFSANDGSLYYDRACDQVRGSYDPNDKSAVPTGYGEFNTIRANTDLEYKIRFQNTGTDTAFRVVIVDTLSTLLDPATIEAGASSHPYRLDVFAGGILHFVFDPVMLPDSNVNEVGSHGFVKFRIAQQPDLPDGQVITNEASIYFDFNEPVVTNTVWHTIGAPFISVDVDEPLIPGVAVDIRPNPFHDQTTVQVTGTMVQQGLFTLFDAQGRTVFTQAFQGNQLELERKNLNQGLYFFQISTAGKALAYGKLQVY